MNKFCVGYTDQHYKELITMHRKLNDSGRLEILAFPCNQFGEQEPEACSSIKQFTEELGVEFRMMDKIDVNGINAHLVYKYLKKVAGPAEIEWNFATYFMIAPGGSISSFSNVSPIRLQGKVKSLLKLSSEL
jgi:glutathione peroxidase